MPPAHRLLTVTAVVFAIATGLGNAQPSSQAQSAPAAQRETPAQELYHVHFVKAAPGKMSELIAAYQAAPVPEGEPGPPLVFRHLQGDDWDLMVLTPLGRDETISTRATPEQQQWTERTRGLRSQHGDTFTAGPPWADLRAMLADAPRPTGTSGSATGGMATTTSGVYTVTTYRSLPGHRDQLADTLRRVAALFPDRRTILQHVEGAPWEFVMISRYDSWSALGADEAAPPESLRKQGFASTEAIGMELREHVAEHRDTIVRMAATPADRR